VHKVQSPFVDTLPALCKPADHFTAITPRNTIVVSSAESRQLLHTLGVTGEILPTPGHSADSVSLVVDGCCAFTGDLPNLHTIDAESNPVACRW
jgi:glyoxylase-like metal-dependent hydrolase (beta-lactamase superfamily II)